MDIRAVLCLLVTMVTVRESLALAHAIIAGIGAAGAVAGGAGTLSKVAIDLAATTYGRGAGRIPDKKPCPEGLRDDGVSCWRDAHIYGKGCCCTLFSKWCCNKCQSGYHDDGCTCRRNHVGIVVNLFQRQYCRSNEDKVGGLCYPKCKEGYQPSGCCLCKQIEN